MRKESIKAAIDVLITARKYSQQQDSPVTQPDSNNNPVVFKLPALGDSNSISDPSADTPLFKSGIDNKTIAWAGLMGNASKTNDLNISTQVSSVINNALLRAGYKENIQYSPQQEDNFAKIIEQDLQNFFSNYGSILSLLAVHL